MCDILLPFVKTNVTAMSPQKRGSLFQKLHGVSPSSHRVIISAKQLTEKAMEYPSFLLHLPDFREHMILTVANSHFTSGWPNHDYWKFAES
jgi:hypothetical protein